MLKASARFLKTEPEVLDELEALAFDRAFRGAFRKARRSNRERVGSLLRERAGLDTDPAAVDAARAALQAKGACGPVSIARWDGRHLPYADGVVNLIGRVYDVGSHYFRRLQVGFTQGYAAVMVDFHGSTGYGQDFTDSIRGDWGGKPLEDLQKGLAAALERYPWIDGERKCALGASYGGYMVNWIAGNWPDRFRCLVNHDGVFDQRSMYYTTEELWFEEKEHGGLPHDARDKLLALAAMEGPVDPREYDGDTYYFFGDEDEMRLVMELSAAEVEPEGLVVWMDAAMSA